MGDKTGIEWTDATWNPTTGCDKVSPGCDHCYAMTLAPRLKAMGNPKYQTDGNPRTSGPGFGFAMHPDALEQPLQWRRPRRIFVNSMSDLFHGRMTLDFLAKVWAVMSVTPRHTYQVLTKRPQIARSIFTGNVEPFPGASLPFKFLVDAERMRMGYPVLPDSARDDGTYAWPLTNVGLGTSVEDQKRAEQRIHALIETPAAWRFLSCEPLLGPVDLAPWLWEGYAQRTDYGTGVEYDVAPTHALDWVIVGGESGRGARPMHPDWARQLRDQCTGADVPFLFKQWGEWRHAQEFDDPAIERRAKVEGWWEKWPNVSAHSVWPDGRHSSTEVPEPGVTASMQRVGKRAAGRELDGRTWDEFPEVDQ